MWLPDTARAAFVCRTCLMEFTDRERMQFQHHVVRCYEEHETEIQAARAPRREFDAPVDQEWADYNETLRARGIDPDRQYDPKFKRSVKRLRES